MAETSGVVHLPDHGMDADDVIAEMTALGRDDLDWRGGRVFSLVYSAGDDVHRLLDRAATLYSAENGLNTSAFPSLGRMQRDVVSIAAGLLGRDGLDGDAAAQVRGFVTSGGTESLLQATRVARDFGRASGAVPEGRQPNMVLATSAHAAFEKAAHYFGVESRRVPVGADFAADVDAMADAIDDDTVLVVGSAPSYPQGIVDPIPALAGLARARDIPCHVDACLGGFLLPFLGRLGHLDRQWDLTVPGVTSISADLHKYGYASKGISVLVYSRRDLARLQPFVTGSWLGGLYGSPSMAGTRPAGPIAAGWAVLHHLGMDGYLELAEQAFRTATAIKSAIGATDGLALRGSPETTVFAFGGDGGPDGLDAFALGDELARLGGWFFDRQTPPDSLHATVHAGHTASHDQLLGDLETAVGTLRGAGATGARAADRRTTYGTV